MNESSLIQEKSSTPPPQASIEELRVQIAGLQPRDRVGALVVCAAVLGTSTGVGLAVQAPGPAWALGQLVLAFASLHWFAVLHEAGHRTLFRHRGANLLVGLLAGICSAIPFPIWRRVHRIHHRWTGWQDLDLTTEMLTPRPRGRLTRTLADVCWRGWIPVFALSYRWGNFWSLRRLRRWFPGDGNRRSLLRVLLVHAAVLGAIVAVGIWQLGIVGLALSFGPAVFLSLLLQDVVILSQHTHVPMRRSQGRSVRPIPAGAQAEFTRSLRFPGWFSRLVLLNLDRHELHHVAPHVPGVDLHRVDWQGPNETSWWPWIRDARRVPGHVFLFQDRDQSGWRG